jgi:hypothetical protein
MTQRAPYLDFKTLRDDGYLQEVNRGFFHPLGLALALVLPTKPGEPEARLMVIDHRDDPEGCIFSPGDLVEKAVRLKAISDARRPAREAALGYWQQPVSDQ